MMKQILGSLLALLLFCGCGTEAPADNTVMITNPFTTYETLAEAEKLLGYSLELPEELSNCESIVCRVANNEALTLLEVIFDHGENEIRLRKSPGTEDISGVYEDFAIIAKDEHGLVMKGDDDNSFRLAVWQDGEYSYSISCGKAVERETLHDWVCSTK